MMKYEIKTAREEENAATQWVQDGRRRSSLLSFGGWWGRWESTGLLPRTDTTLSEKCVCYEVIYVVVEVGHYAVLFCAVQRWQNGVMSGFMITRKKKQAVPNIRIYNIIHMYTTLRHRQITHSFQGYQNVREREWETGMAASAGDVYTIINQSPSASIPIQTHQT